MNWEHLKAMVWLRACLFRNGLRKTGVTNTVITLLILSLAAVASVCVFFAALIVGVIVLPEASANHILVMWNVVIVGFLFFWMMGLVTELQRSEVLSVEKMLHYPISLSGTFLVNYLSAFASATMIVFLPAMFALCIASVVALGPSMLVSFPLVAGFVLMVTAITYQFRGWLGSMMVSKRRRQMIISLLSLLMIMLIQLPNIMNFGYFRTRSASRDESSAKWHAESEKIVEQFRAREIKTEEYSRRMQELQERRAVEEDAAQREKFDSFIVDWVVPVDKYLPLGWPAYGAMQARLGVSWPGWLFSLGLLAIGAISLERSYRATLKFYRGEFGNGRTPASKGVKTKGVKPVGNMLARDLPWIPEEAGVSALETLRSMSRAPEVKMMILVPFVISVVFLGMRLARRGEPSLPQSYWPVLAPGVLYMLSFSLAQLVQNQFGFDRDGFRAFVLSPARRRNILLGKNLALLPLLAGLGFVALIILQLLYPVIVFHFLASIVELLSLFCVMCIFGNYISILSPVAVQGGSLRATSIPFTMVLMRLAVNMAMMVAFIPLMLPLGIELLLQKAAWSHGIPIRLILSSCVFGAVLLIYRLVLNHQGTLLQSREQRILDSVTAKTD